jgi:hypothetical protein
MSEAKDKFWSQALEAPRAFGYGLLGGLLGPLVALGGAVGLLYALTRQLPAIKSVTRSDRGARKLGALWRRAARGDAGGEGAQAGAITRKDGGRTTLHIRVGNGREGSVSSPTRMWGVLRPWSALPAIPRCGSSSSDTRHSSHRCSAPCIPVGV